MATTTAPPLTSTFAPAAFCTEDVHYILEQSHTCYQGTSAVGCRYYQLGATASTSACFPSGWEPTSTAYFSPGICPSGYTAACSSVLSSGSTTETRATCCPSGYQCQTDTGWWWYSTDLCNYPVPSTVTFFYTTSVVGQGVLTTSAAGGGQQAINAFGLQIRWQSSDLASTSSTSSIATQTSSTPLSSESVPSETNPPATQSSTEGLSIGAKVGIGVGVAVVVLLLLAGLLLFWRKRKNLSTAQSATQFTPELDGAARAELEAPRGEHTAYHSTGVGQARKPQELQATRQYVELYA